MARQTSFTVHLAPARPGRDADEAVQFVPDSFSFVAFLVPWGWFLWNRMWLTFIVYLVVMAVAFVALTYSGFPPSIRMAISFAISFLIGLEATNLRRRSLRWRGYREAGVVVAANREAAERRWFVEQEAAPRPAYAPVPAFAATSAHPIGLFPEAEPGARGIR
ncbi:MAG: DUF2628 domain-containing protein [Phreatobacter sp.]|uniref:DUF2628 domain-containing protein n=1 Tax=Phreatobacter sp. TaxID=1966341 RepID=UPI001A4A17A7|nr:DUF2628 domain-containing protein [Phreatobacter sp.]MBL8569513.1 DUF2628 domain-containing protein [Phreatobacter sp.]